jgi:hypothetical protein
VDEGSSVEGTGRWDDQNLPNDAHRLEKYCERKRIKSLVRLDGIAINNWRTERKTEQTNRSPEPGIKRGTANNRIAVLRLFFTFNRRMRRPVAPNKSAVVVPIRQRS